MKNVIVLVGPSGVGKDTLANEIVQKNKDIAFSVSYTTREPRKGEKNGVEYYFVSNEEFERIDFIESAEFLGNKYGTSKEGLNEMFSKGLIPLLILEPKGLENLKKYKDEMNILAIGLTIDLETTKTRMLKRGDDINKINKRLEEQEFFYKSFEKDGYNLVISTENQAETYQKVVDFLTKSISLNNCVTLMDVLEPKSINLDKKIG